MSLVCILELLLFCMGLQEARWRLGSSVGGKGQLGPEVEISKANGLETYFRRRHMFIRAGNEVMTQG